MRSMHLGGNSIKMSFTSVIVCLEHFVSAFSRNRIRWIPTVGVHMVCTTYS